MRGIRIRLLGMVHVEREGRDEITGFVSSKALALFCYLAVNGGPYPRPVLAGLLWGDKSERAAQVNLRRVLANLRRLLPTHLIITRTSVAFNRKAPYRLDVEEFENLTRRHDDIAALERAVALYRGHFMEGLKLRGAPEFEEWIRVLDSRYHSLAVDSLHRLADHYTAQGDFNRAIFHVERLLELEPWCEEGHRLKMWLLAHTGRHNAALAQYTTCCRILERDLGVKPAAETTALYERIRAARSLTPPVLPPQPTPFVGREEEVKSIIRRLMRPDCCLLTLWGPGGVGKTRLALRASKLIHHRFLHGVYFVPLADLSSPSLIPTAVARALGFASYGDGRLNGKLINYLRDKELLLVLDNFEHLIGGAEWVVEVLSAAPEVKILVTSRERLRLRWEEVFEVGGMEVPGVDEARPEDFDSVRLFIELARRVRPDFSFAREKEAVLRMCRLVEGLPLGIDLLTAEMQDHTCNEILEDMSRSLISLRSATRDMAERHRSLQATFDHSWSLLGEEERKVFRRLSVFRGGFDKRAAGEICEASPKALRVLVAKSLIRHTPSGRYEMLEVLRQYAAEKLRAFPQDEAITRDRHSAYYALMLGEMNLETGLGKEQEAIERIEIESENIRAAWDWAVIRRRNDLLQQALTTLALFYQLQGWFQEGKEICEGALRMIQDMKAETGYLSRADDRLRANLLLWKGTFSYHLGLYQEAEEAIIASHSLAERLGEEYVAAAALNWLGILNDMQGEYEEGRRFFIQSIELYRRLGKRGLVRLAYVLNNLGITERILGDYAAAERYTREGLDVGRRLEDGRIMARAVQNLGIIARCREDYAAARKFYRESLELFRMVGERWGEALALGNIGEMAWRLGEYEEAVRVLEESLALRREMGDRLGMVIALNSLGGVYREQGRFRKARETLLEALEVGMEIRSHPMMLDTLVELASLFADQGKDERALEILLLPLRHQATEAVTREQARSLLDKLAARLPPEKVSEAEERGRDRDLLAAVRDILREEPHPGPPKGTLPRLA